MNFALILFIATSFTGVLWLVDKFWARRRRSADAPDPLWVEYGAGFFPVFLAVFFLRSFIAEPFKIPSGSMLPTLVVGDFILVNKFTYGIRLPVINKKVVENNQPKRGDVMVFRYPPEPSLDYIKRVIGVPGDEVRYESKKLFVNGVELKQDKAADYHDMDRAFVIPSFTETSAELSHRILIEKEAPAHISQVADFPYRENCHYNHSGFRCVVPPGHYFMMGDNRDNSQDSRFWGFVPDENIVGKAFFIWFNFSDFQRIGRFY
jgi:signal peptidase I